MPIAPLLALLAFPLASTPPQTVQLTGDISSRWEVATDFDVATSDGFRDLAVVDGVAYSVGRSGNRQWLAQAREIATGAELWTTTDGGSLGLGAFATNVAVVGDVVVLGGSRYDPPGLFTTGAQGLLAGLDRATGQLLWSRELGSTPFGDQTWTTVASMLEPTPDGDLVVLEHNEVFSLDFGYDPETTEFLRRIDVQTGDEIWSASTFPIDDVRGIRVSPDGSEIAVVGYEAVHQEFGGFNHQLVVQERSLANGAMVWSTDVVAGIPAAAWDDLPARAVAYSLDGTRLFVGTGYFLGGGYSVDANGGGVLWGSISNDFDISHVEVADSGRVVFAGAADGELRLDLRAPVTGALLGSWSGSSAERASDLLVANGQAFLGGIDDAFVDSDLWTLVAIELDSGQLDWELVQGALDDAVDQVGGLALEPGSGDLLIAGQRYVPGEFGQARLERRSSLDGASLAAWDVGGSTPGDQELRHAIVSADGARVYSTGLQGELNPITTSNPAPVTGAWIAAHGSLDGALLWSAVREGTGAAPEGLVVHDDPASQRVFQGGAEALRGFAAAYDRDTGAEVWSVALDPIDVFGDDVLDVKRVPGQPVVVALVAAGSSLAVVGLDLSTGAELWSFLSDAVDGNQRPYLAVAPDGSRVYVGATSYIAIGKDRDPAVVALDALTGSVLWTGVYDHTGQNESWDLDLLEGLQISADGSALFVLALTSLDNTFQNYASAWTRIDATDGSVQWQAQVPAGGGAGFFNLTGATLAPDGTTIVGRGTLRASGPDFAFDLWVQAIETGSGQARWTSVVPTTASVQFNGYDAAVTRDGSTVVVAAADAGSQITSDALAVALEMATGAEVWRLEAAGPSPADEAFRSVGLLPDGRAVLLGSHEGGAGGDRDLVLRALELPTLTAAPSELSLSTGGTLALALSGGVEQADRLGLVLGSASGTAPGIDLGGGTVLPLVFDAYTNLTLVQPNQGALVGTLTTLDAEGHADAALVVPPGAAPGLAGLGLSHAWVAFDLSAGIALVSHPVTVELQP